MSVFNIIPNEISKPVATVVKVGVKSTISYLYLLVVNAIARHRKRRSELALERLDDYLLDDVGLTRYQGKIVRIDQSVVDIANVVDATNSADVTGSVDGSGKCTDGHAYRLLDVGLDTSPLLPETCVETDALASGVRQQRKKSRLRHAYLIRRQRNKQCLDKCSDT